ncbi:unnamed protein product [Closterium sp. NIES-54]
MTKWAPCCILSSSSTSNSTCLGAGHCTVAATSELTPSADSFTTSSSKASFSFCTFYKLSFHSTKSFLVSSKVPFKASNSPFTNANSLLVVSNSPLTVTTSPRTASSSPFTCTSSASLLRSTSSNPLRISSNCPDG